MKLSKLSILILVLALNSKAASAEFKNRLFKVQTHAGQLDHDGILSPGEIPNRGIDYERAQRDYRWRGDSRVENPENDAAAYQDRLEPRGQLRYDWRRDEDERVRRDREHRERSWWRWW